MNRTKISPTPELDELDLALINELQADARQNYRKLAAKLGTTSVTVRKRMDRLIQTQTISIVCVTNPSAVGYPVQALIGITARAGKVDALADHLGSLPRVRIVMLTTGRYDMIIGISCRQTEGLMAFLDEQLGSAPDLMNAETMIILRNEKIYWLNFQGEPTTLQQDTPCTFSELELNLIRRLELNPRESITNLSKKLGISRLSTSRKLQPLLNNRVVNVASIINPKACGFGIQASIFIKVQPGKIRSAAKALAVNEKVLHVILLSGYFDISIWANFRDMTELSHFLRNELGDVPGTVHHETMLVLDYPKLSFSLLT